MAQQWPCWELTLALQVFFCQQSWTTKQARCFDFLSYTPTASVFVTAVSRVVMLCVKLGQAQAALLNLFLTYFMKSLSSAQLGQAEEGLSHSHTHVLMDVNKLRRLVQSFLLVIRSPQISNSEALAVYLLALGWAGGCASQSSSEEEPFLHWSVHRS